VHLFDLISPTAFLTAAPLGSQRSHYIADIQVLIVTNTDATAARGLRQLQSEATQTRNSRLARPHRARIRRALRACERAYRLRLVRNGTTNAPSTPAAVSSTLNRQSRAPRRRRRCRRRRHRHRLLDRWCCYFLSGNDAWIRKQFEDAGAAADLDAEWTFEVQFDDDLLQSVSVVSRAWAEFSRPREDDDDDSGNVIASVGFQDRDDDAGTDPILSASTWVPLLITKIKANV
jgi:hypothetical protein